MDDPDVCHVLLIFFSTLALLPSDPGGQTFLSIVFVLPCVWYALQAHRRQAQMQNAGMWRERIRGVRG